jgi:hypothetical protein
MFNGSPEYNYLFPRHFCGGLQGTGNISLGCTAKRAFKANSPAEAAFLPSTAEAIRRWQKPEVAFEMVERRVSVQE